MATYDFLVPMFFSQYISYKHSLIYYYITVENYMNSNKKIIEIDWNCVCADF